jgi:hypothetical protein
VLREWLWRGRRLGGRLRYGVTIGLIFGIGEGVVFYWVLGSPRSAVAAVIAGVVGGAGFGVWMAVSRDGFGMFAIRELSELPPSGRVAAVRAVMRGEPISDPSLAPGVLALAKSVMESVRRQQAPWSRWLFFVFAALALLMAVATTSTGPVQQAAYFWAAAVVCLVFGWARPRALRRLRDRAEAAGDYAAGQIGRSSAD